MTRNGRFVVVTLAIALMIASSFSAFGQAVVPAERFNLNRTVRGIPTYLGWSANTAGAFGHAGRITEVSSGSDDLRQVVLVSVGDNADFAGTVLFGANTASPDASPSFKYRVEFNGRSARVVSSDGADIASADVVVADGQYQISWYKLMTPGVGEYPTYAVSAGSEMVPELGTLTSQQLDQNCGSTGTHCNYGFACNRTAGTCESVAALTEKAPWGSTFGTPTKCTDGTWVPYEEGCGGLYRGGTGVFPGHGCAASAPCWCGNGNDYQTQKDNGFGWACLAASPRGSIACDMANCLLPASQRK